MLTMMPAYSRFHRAGVAIANIASPMASDIRPPLMASALTPPVGIALARPSAKSNEDICQADIPVPVPAST